MPSYRRTPCMETGALLHPQCHRSADVDDVVGDYTEADPVLRRKIDVSGGAQLSRDIKDAVQSLDRRWQRGRSNSQLGSL
jgi:hypothetical protein